MTSRDIVETLIDRLEASHPSPAFFSADEAAEWPDDALEFLTSSQLLQRTRRPSSLVCDGCECSCIKEVHVNNGARGHSPRAFLICNEPPDLGRVEVAPKRLVQFRMTFVGLGNFLRQASHQEVPFRRCAQNVIFIRTIGGRYGMRDLSLIFEGGALFLTVGQERVPACDALCWRDQALKLNDRIIRRVANRKAPSASRSTRYVADKSHQKQKTRDTDKRDKEIRAEVIRLQRDTSKNALEICRQLASEKRFHKIQQGKRAPLSYRRIYRIFYEPK